MLPTNTTDDATDDKTEIRTGDVIRADLTAKQYRVTDTTDTHAHVSTLPRPVPLSELRDGLESGSLTLVARGASHD
jgi:hypothetical protein